MTDGDGAQPAEDAPTVTFKARATLVSTDPPVGCLRTTAGGRLVTTMSVNVNEGDTAPDFTAPDQGGNPVSLKDFRGKHVVLYFYPKDDTPGCTTEAKNFAEKEAEFKELDAAIVGVSADSEGSHKDFAEKTNIAFPLIADPDMHIINQYGVGKGDMAQRITFIIDPEGQVAEVYDAVDPNDHPNRVLNDLKTMVKAT